MNNCLSYFVLSGPLFNLLTRFVDFHSIVLYLTTNETRDKKPNQMLSDGVLFTAWLN